MEDISSQIDIVNVFRPSKETPDNSKKCNKVGAKTLWLQFGIQNNEAYEEISKSAGLLHHEQMYKARISKIIFKNETSLSSSFKRLIKLILKKQQYYHHQL